MIVLGILGMIGLSVWLWLSIPLEPQENIDARKKYGKVDE